MLSVREATSRVGSVGPRDERHGRSSAGDRSLEADCAAHRTRSDAAGCPPTTRRRQIAESSSEDRTCEGFRNGDGQTSRAPLPSGWTGRWSLVRRRGTLGPDLPEEERAERIARQWLARYGIVSREWWRRERPPVSWRSIYRELKRLEFRGEVRRGYFVKGLGGAQFALPDAVEWLRTVASEDQSAAGFVVMAASDPANVYNLPLELVDRDPLSRPRGSGALLVMRGGRVAIAVEGRGKPIHCGGLAVLRRDHAAKKAFLEHLRGEKAARYLMLALSECRRGRARRGPLHASRSPPPRAPSANLRECEARFHRRPTSGAI